MVYTLFYWIKTVEVCVDNENCEAIVYCEGTLQEVKAIFAEKKIPIYRMADESNEIEGEIYLIYKILFNFNKHIYNHHIIRLPS